PIFLRSGADGPDRRAGLGPRTMGAAPGRTDHPVAAVAASDVVPHAAAVPGRRSGVVVGLLTDHGEPLVPSQALPQTGHMLGGFSRHDPLALLSPFVSRRAGCAWPATRSSSVPSPTLRRGPRRRNWTPTGRP